MNHKKLDKKTMQAVIVSEPGGIDKLQLKQIPIPIPDVDEVLIHVMAAGVNKADIEQRRGEYPPPVGASPILGLEVAGTIVEVGKNVTVFKKGDRVMALLSGGGYAEYALAHKGVCLPIPKTMDYVQAASIPEASFTIWSTLFNTAKLKTGETLLVHGGTGGVGSFAIQLAKLLGVKVIATVGTDEKRKVCYALNADKVINYKTEDFFTVVKNFTNEDGVDVILDLVGGDYIERNINLLRRCGRLVLIDCQGDVITKINLIPIITRNLLITGAVLKPRPMAEKIAISEDILKYIMPLLDSGKIIPLIANVFPISDVQKAHELLESGRQIGKVVLSIN